VELRIAEFLTNSNVDFHKVKFLAAYPIGDTKIRAEAEILTKQNQRKEKLTFFFFFYSFKS